MEQTYISKTFDKIDYTTTPLPIGEYDDCTFNSCNFSNTDLANIIFIDCTFINCNLSLAKLQKTALRTVKFRNSKMLGLRFDNCNQFLFSVSFDNCILDHSTFYQVKLKKTFFKRIHLLEVDFTQCDLSTSVFDNCDLSGARFDNTILEKADFQSSFNYSIDPDLNKIKKAKFSLTGISGLLDKYDIEII